MDVDKTFFFCSCLLLSCLTGAQALLCYWCSGVGQDRECEKHPYDVRTGPIYINCRSSFCITTKVTDAKTGRVESFARLCDNIPRGNQCVRDSRLLTCYQTCTHDLCNSANPGPHYLNTVNHASDSDDDGGNSDSNDNKDLHTGEDEAAVVGSARLRDGVAGSWLDKALGVSRYNNLEASLGFRERLARARGKAGDTAAYRDTERYEDADGYGDAKGYGDAEMYREEADINVQTADATRYGNTLRYGYTAGYGDKARYDNLATFEHAALFRDLAENSTVPPFPRRPSPERVRKGTARPSQQDSPQARRGGAGGGNDVIVKEKGGEKNQYHGTVGGFFADRHRSHRHDAGTTKTLSGEITDNNIHSSRRAGSAEGSISSEASTHQTPDKGHKQSISEPGRKSSDFSQYSSEVVKKKRPGSGRKIKSSDSLYNSEVDAVHSTRHVADDQDNYIHSDYATYKTDKHSRKNSYDRGGVGNGSGGPKLHAAGGDGGWRHKGENLNGKSAHGAGEVLSDGIVIAHHPSYYISTYRSEGLWKKKDSVGKKGNSVGKKGDSVGKKGERVAGPETEEDILSEPASKQIRSGEANPPSSSGLHQSPSENHRHTTSLASDKQTETPSVRWPSLRSSTTGEMFTQNYNLRSEFPTIMKEASNASFELSELGSTRNSSLDTRMGKSHGRYGRRQLLQPISEHGDSASLNSGSQFTFRGVLPGLGSTFPTAASGVASVPQYLYPIHFPGEKAPGASQGLPSRPPAYLYPNPPFASRQATDRGFEPGTNRTMGRFDGSSPARFALRDPYLGSPRNHNQLYLHPMSGGLLVPGDRRIGTFVDSDVSPTVLPQPFPYSGLLANHNRLYLSINSQSPNVADARRTKGGNPKEEEAFIMGRQGNAASHETFLTQGGSLKQFYTGSSPGNDEAVLHGNGVDEPEPSAAERWAWKEDDLPASLHADYDAAFVESGYVRDSFDSLVSAFRQHPENRYPDPRTRDDDEETSVREVTTTNTSSERSLIKPQLPTIETSTSKPGGQFNDAPGQSVSAYEQGGGSKPSSDGLKSSEDSVITDEQETTLNRSAGTWPVTRLSLLGADSEARTSLTSSDNNNVTTDRPPTPTLGLSPQQSPPRSTKPTRIQTHGRISDSLKKNNDNLKGSVKTSKDITARTKTKALEDALTDEINAAARPRSSAPSPVANRKISPVQDDVPSPRTLRDSTANNAVAGDNTPQTSPPVGSTTRQSSPVTVDFTTSTRTGGDIAVSNPNASVTRTERRLDTEQQAVDATHVTQAYEMTSQQSAASRFHSSANTGSSTTADTKERHKGQLNGDMTLTATPPETGSSGSFLMTESLTRPQIPSTPLAQSTVPVPTAPGMNDQFSAFNATSVATVLGQVGEGSGSGKEEQETVDTEKRPGNLNGKNPTGKTITLRLRKTSTGKDGMQTKDHLHKPKTDDRPHLTKTEDGSYQAKLNHIHHPRAEDKRHEARTEDKRHQAETEDNRHQARIENKRHVLTSRAKLNDAAVTLQPAPGRQEGFSRSYTRRETTTAATTASAIPLHPLHAAKRTVSLTLTAGAVTRPAAPNKTSPSSQPASHPKTTDLQSTRSPRHGGLSNRGNVQATATLSGTRVHLTTTQSARRRLDGFRLQLLKPLSTEASASTASRGQEDVRDTYGHFQENLGHVHDAEVDKSDVGRNSGNGLGRLRTWWTWTVLCLAWGCFV